MEMLKSYSVISICIISGELIVVAIGALTNIALAIKLDPDFVKRLSQLYVAAGHVYSK